jgi:hypothetical protein
MRVVGLTSNSTAGSAAIEGELCPGVSSDVVDNCFHKR